MRATRVHLDQPLQADSEIALPAAAAHHLLRVLRLRPGARLQVFNGDGLQYPGEIVAAAGRDGCRVRLGQAEQPTVEAAIEVTLVQAIGRGERMDWAVQKATELGVARIQPVFTERTEVRLTGQRLERRREHWQQVAIAAAEQSGRVQVPTVESPRSLQTVEPGPGLNLFLDPEASMAAGELHAPSPAACCVVVGPEGGLSAAETGQLERLGFRGLRLGPRILRTETAGPAVLACLHTRFGDWS
ncbi:MAG: 16S rRNA (uracil(1498)-N(3))-methyltransferase [Wenzhouxiangella sp.]